jgi:predicted nucleic acid-binding protein
LITGSFRASDAAAGAAYVEVQLLLADQGRHRAPSIPDLLVAAAAELAGLTVLHVDKDFELIAEVTGQPVERIAD